MVDWILQAFPLWLFGLLLLGACILAAKLGRYLRRRDRAKAATDDGNSDAEGYVVGAIFGLLAFLIGFTFSMAADRYESRRGWVAEEANAISTAFLRAGLFDAPHSTRLQSTLREYAHTRIAPNGVWDEQMAQQLERSNQLKLVLWDQTFAAVHPVRETDQASYFVEAMNDMLDIGTRRELAGEQHIPNRIVVSLLLYLLVSSGVLGYIMGEQGRFRRATTLLYALLALAIVMILDLDRPRSGSIQVSQQGLEDLVAELDRLKLPPGAAPPAPR